jgi:leader peptidase (prepilin peptidase)/N-methyltransferase
MSLRKMSDDSNAFEAKNNLFKQRAYSGYKGETYLLLRFPGDPDQDIPVFPSKVRMLVDAVFIGFFSTLCLLGAVLAWIDIRDGIIPDWLNLSVAGLGLARIVIVGGLGGGIEAAGEGAAVGLTFWLLRRLYFGWRKIQGLGLGDVKFLAAAAIWIGIAGLPALLLIAALTALAAAGVLQLAGRDMTRRTSLPFGPFLTIGLLLALIVQQIPGGI